MEIIKIEPQGYCGGVKYALKKVYEAINDTNTIKPIYLLGNIIHNKYVVDDIINNGVILIDDKNKTRLELLDQIDSGTVITSAHGVSAKVYEKALKKGLNIIDATCPNVLKVHKEINDYLKNDYEIIYVGTLKHPEVEGVLGISDKIHFISSIDDLKNLNIASDKIFSTNQTTLSIYDIENIFNELKIKYPNIIIDDKICNATTIRQEALANQKKVDLCIIIGDKNSSNTKKLVSVSREKSKINTILIESLNDLDDKLLENVNSVSISSGASTPSYLVDEVIQYLSTK